MPSITFTSNLPKFQQATKEKQGEFIAAVQLKLDRLNRFFIGKIQKEQMNFRKDGPPVPNGTRVQTGMLKRNWFQQAVVTGQSVKARVWSTTPYAPLHENGGTIQRNTAWGRITKPYKVVYHKRLHIGEAWQASYMPEMRNAINQAFASTIGATA